MLNNVVSLLCMATSAFFVDKNLVGVNGRIRNPKTSWSNGVSQSEVDINQPLNPSNTHSVSPSKHPMATS